MLYQKMQELLATGHKWEDMLYLNFEDDRLSQFDIDDFDLILEAHSEMYGKRPMLFLDEAQAITNDESDTIEDEYGTIEILPIWKWLLQTEN